MPFGAFAQVNKTNTENSTIRSHRQSSINVYDFDYVEIQPQFPGGERGLMNFVNKTREYPYQAYESRIEGRVICSFIIMPDGSVTNVMVLRGARDESLNLEAMRVIKKMPKWKAGRVGGQAVAVRCILPIVFRL